MSKPNNSQTKTNFLMVAIIYCLACLFSSFFLYNPIINLTNRSEKTDLIDPKLKIIKTITKITTSTKPATIMAPLTTATTFVPDYTIPKPVNGMDQVITNLKTNQPIVFLGIDDGAYKDQSVIDLMKVNNIKASLFLSKLFIASNPDFFKKIIAEGSLVEDHTISHDTTMVWDQSYIQQKNEICQMADYDEKEYGRKPILFRPPGGTYSTTMQKAAYACGMKAIVTWIAKANGGSMQYQIGNKLRPGDVVLMHFRPSFKEDMQAFVNAEKAAGLHTELLEDAIK